MRRKRLVLYVIYILLGVVLMAGNVMGAVDEYWSGMGSGLICVSILQLIREFRLWKNEAYREKFEVAQTDERTRFIRNKAWAWAGYLFIILAAVSSIVLRLAGQDLLSAAAGYSVCLMLLLYWGSYMVLAKKY